MVKVGDKITSKQTGITYRVEGIDRKVIWVNGGGYLLKEDLNKFKTPYDKEIDYKQLYEQQKQRADELEKSLSLSNLASNNTLVEELQKALSESNERADDLKDVIERFLYANRESDVYAICSEEELLSEYERLNKI